MTGGRPTEPGRGGGGPRASARSAWPRPRPAPPGLPGDLQGAGGGRRPGRRRRRRRRRDVRAGGEDLRGQGAAAAHLRVRRRRVAGGGDRGHVCGAAQGALPEACKARRRSRPPAPQPPPGSGGGAPPAPFLRHRASRPPDPGSGLSALHSALSLNFYSPGGRGRSGTGGWETRSRRAELGLPVCQHLCLLAVGVRFRIFQQLPQGLGLSAAQRRDPERGGHLPFPAEPAPWSRFLLAGVPAPRLESLKIVRAFLWPLRGSVRRSKEQDLRVEGHFLKSVHVKHFSYCQLLGLLVFGASP